jgi:phosphoenolpyruvate carboxylase
MQSLSKVNFSLTRFLAEDKRFSDVWKTLEEEMSRTRKLLLEVASAEQLLPADAAIRESIALRETIVFPVLVIQQYALAKLRENDLRESEKEVNRKLVVKSMAAIVNAGRNAV